MSTYWGLHCVECDRHTGLGRTHDSQELSNLARLAPFIYQLSDADTSDFVEIRIRGGFDGEAGTWFRDWLENHGEHSLELYNLHGKYFPLEPYIPKEVAPQ